MLSSFQQPAVQGLVQRMSHELQAKAVVLLHSSGQVICKSGWIEDGEFASMAALVAAMTSAGSTLGRLGEDSDKGAPSRIHCESETIGLYAVAINQDYWIATLYDQPLNPGLHRMKVRRYGESLARLGVQLPEQWEKEEDEGYFGDTLAPGGRQKDTLFENITDDEIDSLFDEGRG